jgi:hypothetical protein
MATALYVQFRLQRQHLLTLGARWRLFHKTLFVSPRSAPNRIAQGQKGRPCFPFSFEEDEEQTQEGRRRDKICATPSHRASSTHTPPKLPFGLASSLLRGAGALF